MKSLNAHASLFDIWNRLKQTPLIACPVSFSREISSAYTLSI